MRVCVAHYQKKCIHVAKDDSRNVAKVTEDSMGILISTIGDIYTGSMHKGSSQ